MASRPLKIAALTLLFLALFASPAVFALAENDELTAEERISANDLYKLMQEKADILVFDARNKHDYDTLHITGAVLPLPLSFYNDTELFKVGIIPKAPEAEPSLEEAMKMLPRDRRIITYCNRDCKAAAKLLRTLNRLGFKNVRAMEEGIQAWEEKGYPVALSA
jgi:rhodanese-related sulfurtransferase